MTLIEMHQMTPAFRACWVAAGRHLDRQVDGGIKFWLRAHPHPPWLEHLSFRLGNQLFFIRIVDVDDEMEGPGNPEGALTAARLANGIACVMPMRLSRTGEWTADVPGWGLLDEHTGQPLNPVDLVTDERIEMNAWECQSTAVQVVRDIIAKEGYRLSSWQSDLRVDPSVWFVGSSGGLEWVVVRCVTYPALCAERPANWEAIAASVAQMSKIGHFASVSLSSTEQDYSRPDAPPHPLWRGHAMHVKYKSLA
jgi:hypothetical protein